MAAALSSTGAAQGLPGTRADSASVRLAGSWLDGAIAALGGESALRSIRSVRIHATGTEFRSAQVQGPDPARPTATPHEEWLTIDVTKDGAALENHSARHDGSDRWRRFAYIGGDRSVVDLFGRFESRIPFPAAPGIRRDLMRRVPHFLLLDASDHRDGLRALGDSSFDGRAHRVISWTPEGHRVPLRVFIDAASARVSRVAYEMDYPGIGDAGVELRFAPYVAHERGTAFPSGHTLSLGGRTFHEVRYRSVLVDDPRADSGFAIPDDIAAQNAAPGAVLQPSPGVYVVNELGGFTAMFVEFRDFVVAIEAPAQGYVELDQVPADGLPPASTISDALIAKIRATLPSKPIRYVAVTHFHNDHAGGVRAFAAEGATLLTTPGTKSYFDRLLMARVTLAPDRLATAPPRAPAVETVAERRVLTDGERVLELINVGCTPHTDEALVAYLPAERIMYQGDQFYFQGDDRFPPRDRLGVMQDFARWVERAGRPVDRVYGTHMSGFASARHLRDVLHLPAPPGTRQCASPSGAGR